MPDGVEVLMEQSSWKWLVNDGLGSVMTPAYADDGKRHEEQRLSFMLVPLDEFTRKKVEAFRKGDG